MGLAQKVVWPEETTYYWERGRPRPHSVRSTLRVNLLDDVAVSRFALIAGEGARVPSNNRLVPDWIDFLGKAGRGRALEEREIAAN